MEGRTVQESSVIMSQMMTVTDANIMGNVHGGVIMRMVDIAAGVVGARHCRRNVVTASVDRLDFHFPVHVGDLVTVKASLNMVGSTSMEVGVRVETEKIFSGLKTRVASAYLTMVSLDSNGRPTPVPSLILETDEDRRRNRDAIARREVRLREKKNTAAQTASRGK